MIVHLFIEVSKDKRQVDLEALLHTNGYPFYDASPITNYGGTLEEIEAELEGK